MEDDRNESQVAVDKETRGGKNWIPLVGIGVVLVAVLIAWKLGYVDPKGVADWLKSVGDKWWAPVAFIALYVLFNVFLLPATALTLAAGLVWGWVQGGLWVLAASTIASFIPYLIARNGSDWVETKIRNSAGKLYEKLQSEGFMTLLLLRLVPLAPYNVLNYAAGFAGIRMRDYLLATFIGTIPGIFIFTYLADSIAKGVVSGKEAFVRILIAGALLGGLALVTRVFASRVRSRIE